MESKIITFWSPVKRQGGCSTNVALYASYLSHVMNETEKAVLLSININADVTDYLTLSSIRNGCRDLLFLSETNNISSKEDVLAYTHKISENLDILGTGKDREIMKNSVKIIEILAAAYDYILIDSVTDSDGVSFKIIDISDLIVVCIPQDRFVYENLNMSMFENKRVVFLSSMHNEKNELSINKIQAMVPVQVYPLSRNDKINQAVYNQNIFSYIGNELKRKAGIITELDNLHREIKRLISIEDLNIKYEIRKGFEAKNYNISPADEKITEPKTKIIKEYKIIKAKNNIAVINLNQGAGSTFVTLNLAYALRDKKVDVSVIEVPYENMKADILNIISVNDEDYNYVPVSELINSGNERKKEAFLKNGIRFYINNKKIDSWSHENNIEYISLISKESNINIYDIGSQTFESLNYLFSIIDVVIAVIDPMPYKLLQAEERINFLKGLEDKSITVIYVINRYIKDLNKKDIEKYLQVKISACVPFINPETIYAAYYSGQTAYQLEKSELFRDSLQKILSSANVLEYENKRKNRKFSLFKWR